MFRNHKVSISQLCQEKRNFIFVFLSKLADFTANWQMSGQALLGINFTPFILIGHVLCNGLTCWRFGVQMGNIFNF